MNIFILAAGLIDPNMSWDTYWAGFWTSLEILWKGLLAIAIVIVAIIIVTIVMNKISENSQKKKAEQEKKDIQE